MCFWSKAIQTQINKHFLSQFMNFIIIFNIFNRLPVSFLTLWWWFLKLLFFLSCNKNNSARKHIHRFSVMHLSLCVDMYMYMSLCVHARVLTYTYIFLLYFFFICMLPLGKEAFVARHTATISALLGECRRSVSFKVTRYLYNNLFWFLI